MISNPNQPLIPQNCIATPYSKLLESRLCFQAKYKMKDRLYQNTKAKVLESESIFLDWWQWYFHWLLLHEYIIYHPSQILYKVFMCGLCSAAFLKYQYQVCWKTPAIYVSNIKATLQRRILFLKKYCMLSNHANSTWCMELPLIMEIKCTLLQTTNKCFSFVFFSRAYSRTKLCYHGHLHE